MPAPTTTDLGGDPRFHDDPGTPDTGIPNALHPEIVDMGTYEFQGTSPDPCPWDCGNSNDNVGIVDLLVMLAEWGEVGAPCDVDGGGVGINDLLALLAAWGPCP